MFAEPDVVNSLNITSITTTSVSLAWTEPVGNATSYRVQWTPGEGEAFTNATSFTISHLIPGYQYNISVAAVAETSTGKESSKTTFTSRSILWILNLFVFQAVNVAFKIPPVPTFSLKVFQYRLTTMEL